MAMLAIIQPPQTEQAELELKIAEENPLEFSAGNPLDRSPPPRNLPLVLQILHSVGS